MLMLLTRRRLEVNAVLEGLQGSGSKVGTQRDFFCQEISVAHDYGILAVEPLDEFTT